MPRRNRVDPFGDLHAVADRGMFTGNRGCLVDERRDLVRHHNGSLWIICEKEFRGWRHELDAPHRWTPLFFLDEAVALAAGHRPCAFCRPGAYRSYRDAVTAATSRLQPWTASELNRQLAAERLAPGRGLDRAANRRIWTANLDSLPAGAVVMMDGDPHLVQSATIHAFSFSGWGPARTRPAGLEVQVVTPPLTVAALKHGFSPQLHPSLGR